jgi:hypothetical protein
MSVGWPPSPVGCADPGVVAHADPSQDDCAASVADDRAAFIAIGRVDPVADGRADSGTDGDAVPGVIARAESTRRMSVGKPPTPVGCADPGVVAHTNPVADDRAASVADDRAAFIANGRVDLAWRTPCYALSTLSQLLVVTSTSSRLFGVRRTSSVQRAPP